MAGHLLARRRALTGCRLACAAALAGCATTAPGPSVKGGALTIYVSDPSTLAADQSAQDVVGAELLACSQLKGQVSSARVRCQTLGSSRISSNARAAISDTGHAIAYLGELIPGSSADSIGITNAQDLLQVSPTDPAVALTQKSAVVPGSPGHYYESFSTYGHTFARMAPTTDHEAVALISAMAGLGVRSVEVQGDGGDYGRELRAALSSRASGGSVSLASSAASADAFV